MKHLKHIIYILITGLVILSCKRDDVDPYLGPQACPDDNFQITTPFAMSEEGAQTVDFSAAENLGITATFNSAAPWKVVIEGETSHATKVFEGFSNNINVNWHSRPTGEILFTNETVNVTFSIRCKKELTVTKSVNIIMGNYTNDPNLVFITDFDGNGIPFGNWVYYNETDPSGDGQSDTAYCPLTSKTNFCSNYTPSPQGGNYLSFLATQAIPAGILKNIIATYEVYPPSLASAPTDPNQVWFNFYANSEGTPIKVVTAFRDGGGTIRYGKLSFEVNSTGWQAFSGNLGDIIPLEGDEPTVDTQNIGTVFFIFVQSGGIMPARFNLDLVSFSYGESFWGETK